MAGYVGSFLSVSNTEAKLTIVRTDGARRVVPISLDEGKRLVELLRAKGYSGEFPRSKKPKVNVRELVASL